MAHHRIFPLSNKIKSRFHTYTTKVVEAHKHMGNNKFAIVHFAAAAAEFSLFCFLPGSENSLPV